MSPVLIRQRKVIHCYIMILLVFQAAMAILLINAEMGHPLSGVSGFSLVILAWSFLLAVGYGLVVANKIVGTAKTVVLLSTAANLGLLTLLSLPYILTEYFVGPVVYLVGLAAFLAFREPKSP